MPKTQIGEIVVNYLKSMTSDFNNRPFAFTKWKHGAAIVEVNPDKTFQVYNFEINQGQIIY